MWKIFFQECHGGLTIIEGQVFLLGALFFLDGVVNTFVAVTSGSDVVFVWEFFVIEGIVEGLVICNAFCLPSIL